MDVVEPVIANSRVNAGVAESAVVVSQTPLVVVVLLTATRRRVASVGSITISTIFRSSLAVVATPSFVKVGVALVASVERNKPRVASVGFETAPMPPMPDAEVKKMVLEIVG